MTRPRNRFRNPHDLPTRTCAGCGRPFTWRRKWARDWEQVRYCSDRCRGQARSRTNDARDHAGEAARIRPS